MFECLLGADRDRAEAMLDEIDKSGKLDFLGTNDDIEFVEHCRNRRHIHWPVVWLEKLEVIRDRVCE